MKYIFVTFLNYQHNILIISIYYILQFIKILAIQTTNQYIATINNKIIFQPNLWNNNSFTNIYQNNK